MLRRLTLTIIAALAFCCAHGFAQYGWDPAFEQPLATTITDKTVQLLTAALDLNQEQVANADAILARHRERFADFVAQAKPKRAELDRAVDQCETATVAYRRASLEREQTLADLADQQAALDARTLQELKTIATDEQLEHWPEFMREYNRSRWSRWPWMYVDEQPDLVELMENLMKDDPQVKTNQDVVNLLRDYSIKRNQSLEELAKGSIQFSRTFERSKRWGDGGVHSWEIGSAPGEKTPTDKWLASRTSIHKKLRAANRDYLQALQAILPADLGGVLSRVFSTRAIGLSGIGPADLKAEDYIRKVQNLPDLTDDQRDAIAGLLLQYRASVESKNNALYRAQARDVEVGLGQIQGDEEATKADYEQAITARRAVENEYVERARAILNESQQKMVPKPAEVPNRTSAPPPGR